MAMREPKEKPTKEKLDGKNDGELTDEDLPQLLRDLPELPHLNPTLARKVYADGDLLKLTEPERLEYYEQVCKSLGLNPLTRPFEFILQKIKSNENGKWIETPKLILYAKKDCTDQLRKIWHISVDFKDPQVVNKTYVMTAVASTKSGRRDTSTGAVSLSDYDGNPLGGDKFANAIMKSETKAKRRVTLSICGLGMVDESELETMPNLYPASESEPKTKGLAPKSVTKSDIPKADPPKKPAPQTVAQAEKANETKIIPKSEIKKEAGLDDPRLDTEDKNPFEEDLKSGLATTPAEVSAKNQEFLKAELVKVCRSYRDKLVASGMTEIEIDQAMEAQKKQLGDFYDPETALISIMASKGVAKEAKLVQEPDQPERDVYRIDAIDQFKKKDGNNFYKLSLTNPANGGQEAVVWFNFDISKLDPLSLKKGDQITCEMEPGKPWKKKDGTEMQGDPIIKEVAKV